MVLANPSISSSSGTDEEMLAAYQNIAEQIHPYVEKLSFRYESARLLEIYSRCSYHTKRFDWEAAFDRAQAIYEQLHLINHIADLHMFRALMKFNEHQYSEALSMLQASRKTIEEQSGSLDPLKKLDFDYYESILYSATGDKENARRLMEEAIAYSKDQQIFYQINALYRLAGFEALLSGDMERKDYYIGKLRLFAEFSEDEEIEGFATIIEIHYFNSFSHEYEKADFLLEKALKDSPKNEYYFLEKGKALYGMERYEEALDCFKQHRMNRFMHHPYDLSMHYEKEAYMALIYEQLGDIVDQMQLLVNRLGSVKRGFPVKALRMITAAAVNLEQTRRFITERQLFDIWVDLLGYVLIGSEHFFIRAGNMLALFFHCIQQRAKFCGRNFLQQFIAFNPEALRNIG